MVRKKKILYAMYEEQGFPSQSLERRGTTEVKTRRKANNDKRMKKVMGLIMDDWYVASWKRSKPPPTESYLKV